jgi:hypothetical protein
MRLGSFLQLLTASPRAIFACHAPLGPTRAFAERDARFPQQYSFAVLRSIEIYIVSYLHLSNGTVLWRMPFSSPCFTLDANPADMTLLIETNTYCPGITWIPSTTAIPEGMRYISPLQMAIRSSWLCLRPLRVVVKFLAVFAMSTRYLLDQFTTKWFSPSQQYRHRRAEETSGSLVELVSHVCGLLCVFTKKEQTVLPPKWGEESVVALVWIPPLAMEHFKTSLS